MSPLGGIGRRYGLVDTGIDNVSFGEDTTEPSHVMVSVVHPWVYVFFTDAETPLDPRKDAKRP